MHCKKRSWIRKLHGTPGAKEHAWSGSAEDSKYIRPLRYWEMGNDKRLSKQRAHKIRTLIRSRNSSSTDWKKKYFRSSVKRLFQVSLVDKGRNYSCTEGEWQ